MAKFRIFRGENNKDVQMMRRLLEEQVEVFSPIMWIFKFIVPETTDELDSTNSVEGKRFSEFDDIESFENAINSGKIDTLRMENTAKKLEAPVRINGLIISPSWQQDMQLYGYDEKEQLEFMFPITEMKNKLGRVIKIGDVIKLFDSYADGHYRYFKVMSSIPSNNRFGYVNLAYSIVGIRTDMGDYVFPEEEEISDDDVDYPNFYNPNYDEDL